jgi:hypothetical protein
MITTSFVNFHGKLFHALQNAKGDQDLKACWEQSEQATKTLLIGSLLDGGLPIHFGTN